MVDKDESGSAGKGPNLFTAGSLVTNVLKKEGVDMDGTMTRREIGQLCKAIVKEYGADTIKPTEKKLAEM